MVLFGEDNRWIDQEREARALVQMQTFIRYRCPDNTPPLPEFRQTERKEEKEARRDAGAQEQKKPKKFQETVPRSKKEETIRVPIWPQFVGSGEHKPTTAVGK
jgi:hypothetical protein